MQARENLLTEDVKNDYYLTVKAQKSLTLTDLAQEVASTHGHQNASEVEMLTRETLELGNWYLSNGFSITTPMGSFHTTVSGTLLDSELSSAPDRKRIKLNMSYTIGKELRQALEDAELDVEISKPVTGPQLQAIVSAHDVQHPDAVTRGESQPIASGEACIIRGKNLKVGGPTESKPGVTLTRIGSGTPSTIFIPVEKLYPNTPTQVGFVMPAAAAKDSEWEVSICTQLAGNSNDRFLKAPRTVKMERSFIVGQVSGGGTTGGGSGDENDNPLG